MMHLTKKDWICLVPSEQVQQAHARERARRNYNHFLMEHLWRQIEIRAESEHISIRLMNVDEEAAGGGYWRGGSACYERKLAWEDILDQDGLARLFQHEQMVVFQKLDGMLDSLREHMRALRSALAA